MCGVSSCVFSSTPGSFASCEMFGETRDLSLGKLGCFLLSSWRRLFVARSLHEREEIDLLGVDTSFNDEFDCQSRVFGV